MIINFSDYTASQRYHLMTQTIIPRPIAWVLTESTSANDIKSFNLAPFSYFTAVSSKPAILMISVGKKPTGEAKDTLVNVLKNKEMVIHIASEHQADLVTQTAATLAHGESELEALSSNNLALSTVPFDNFSLPRLEQCDIAYGCKLYDVKELGDIPQTLIFVEVTSLYINDKVMEQDDKNRIKVHADSVKPLARLGASEYTGITPPFTKQRPE